MSYYKVPAADVTPLKDEIIDLVSLCLIKEPPFAPVKTGQDEVAPVQVEAPVDAPSDHTSSNGSVEESEASGAPPVKEEEDKKGTEVNEMIQKIRRLVHTISLQDGEFVLKLSLYLRLELNIRQMPNYLVALCAREKNCVPFLTPYLEKIVQLPSDWLSIANFAYYYDSDAAHVFDNGENSDDKGKVVAFAKADTKPNAAAELRIPSGLRQALVSRFEKFDEFSLAKYNNENSEKRKRQKRKNCHQGDWVPRNLNNNKKTFTYKQLVRMLHITKPAYSVCCLLGKRYPPSLEEFKTMGLHESPDGRRREFDPSKCGTRMRLAIPETWETRLAKDGNKGAVWDDLFANNRVPFMAMLRNLRNIVLHQCSVETYTQVIRRLSSEEEVANSKQFPYRFYTAREVVSEAEIHLLDVQNRYQRKLAEHDPSIPSTRPSLRLSGPDKSLFKTVECIENPSGAPHFLPLFGALDSAIRHAVKLNITPIKGSSIAIFCLSDLLKEKIKAVGSAAESTISYLQSAALMVRMLQSACENCRIVLWCHRYFEEYKPASRDEDFLLSVVNFVTRCEWILDHIRAMAEKDTVPNELYYEPDTKAEFPYSYLDSFIENEERLEALVIMDIGHHTYSNMNPNAPSLGDLPAYVTRLRRSGNSRMLYVGVSIRSSAPPDLSALDRDTQNQLTARLRWTNPNDVLLTGFTDSVLRLIAERARGGARALVERMDELHGVKRGAIRLSDSNKADKKRVLEAIKNKEKVWRRHSVEDLPKALRSNTSDMGITESPTSKDSSTAFPSPPPAAERKDILRSFSVYSLDDDEGLVSSPDRNEVYHPTPFIALSKRRGTSSLGGQTTLTAAEEREGASSPPRNFISTLRECRFFISSTFLDMNNERNALVLDIFPRLRRWASEHGVKVSLLDVDLRWGITESSTGENLSTSVCLNEVSRCSPFFIGMLGSRYGSCPSPLQIVADEDIDLEDYDWLQSLTPEEEGKLSVTELEMRHGIRNAKEKLAGTGITSCIFFSRDAETLEKSLPDKAAKEVYDYDSPFAKERLAKLRRYIESEGITVIPYTATFADNKVSETAVMEKNNEYNMEAEMLRQIRREGETYDLRAESDILLPRFYMTNSLPSWDQKKKLTSNDVPLDMSDFANKAYHALREVVANVCGVPVHPPPENLVESAAHQPGKSHDVTPNEQFFISTVKDMRNYVEDLCKVYVRPSGIVDDLAAFALTGVVKGEEVETTTRVEKERKNTNTRANPNGGKSEKWRASRADQNLLTSDNVAVSGSSSHILGLIGEDGDGTSSALAALARHFFQLSDESTKVIFYSAQATDGSVRGLALFLALSLLHVTGIQDEFRVQESDSVDAIILLLPSIYRAIKRRGTTNVIVLLDGLEKSPESGEILSHLGSLVFPGVDPYVRFVLSLTPNSPFLHALQARVPPMVQLSLPLLTFSERAQLVRYHLASYGKKLQETFNLNELKDLLRKQDAAHPSYLTSALAYLRLFSSFDTLRDDIRYLPGTTVRLYKFLFSELEKRFDKATCQAVLTTLYMRQPLGGIMEYNLYRLVSNVAVATRLVALLTGICIDVHHGRLSLTGSFLETIIASVYFPFPSDKTKAFESLLTAELLFQPLPRNNTGNKGMLRKIMQSIEESSVDPTVPCLFVPSRYTPYELVSILQSAALSGRGDVAVVLITYFPFIENAIKLPKVFQRLISILSYIQGTSSERIAQKVELVLMFLQNNYHILSRRPDLLFQCVLNSSREALPISTYSEKQIRQLQETKPSEPKKESSSATLSPHMLWVRWVNGEQHGGDSRLSVYKPSQYEITCMAVSEEGDKMAMGCKDFAVRISALHTPEMITATLKHVGVVTAVTFVSQRSNILVSACDSSLVYVWSLDDNTLAQVGASHLRPVTSLSCHPTEPLLLTGGQDTYCMFWDLLGLSSSLSGSLLSHAQSLHGGRVILKEGISTKTLNKFSTLRTSGKRSSLTPFRVERHHSAPVSAVCFHSSGEVCATGCWGGKLCLLNLSIIKAENIQVEEVDENGKRVPRSANPPQASSPYEVQSFQLNCAIRSVQFVPSMMILCAVACFDGDIYLFDHAARSQSLHIEHSHNHPMTAMAFSLDGRWMATADEQGSLHLSFAGVAGTVASIFNGHKGAITALQFDPAREDVLISAGEDCSVQMWSTVRKEKKKLLSAHGLVVTALAVSSAGDYFVSAAADGTAYVFKQNLEQPSSRKANPCESDTAFVPSFLLQHDGHRISMVTTALYDTRIIVGTVHGNLYVWSSSPDFSLRSGRLLHKVNVSRYCPYPIIAIDVNDGPLQTEPTPTTDALLREEPSKNRSKYAYITSMTFNGEIASFYIFDDSISHTFREKMLADAGFQGVREEEDYEEDEQKYVLPVTRSLVSWLGSKAEVQPLSKHMRAFRFGEELIDSFPLFARYKKSPPGRASDEKRSEGIQPIASQFSIGVGRRSLFLISHTDSYAATLTVHKRRFNIMNDEPFATELQLAEEEVFVAVSNCHRDESTPQLRFSVATSEGNIFNLHLLYNAESLCMVAESGVVAAQKYVRATVHSRLCLLKNSLNERVDGNVGGGESIPLSERLLVQCLDVSFPQECDTDDSAMYLFVGCDDGSTHLLVQQKEGEHVYFKELAVYYGSSSLSAITTVNCRDGSGLDTQPPRAPNFFWVVGDALGNVYQLCLETNFDAVPKEISELREKRNANESTPLELARLAVQHCMAAAPPTTIGPDHGQEASLAPELKEQGGPRGQYQNGWSWRSKNFGDWLTDVNFDAIESDLQTVNPPPTAVKKKRPVEEGCLSKHYRTDFNALLSEVAPNSTQLYNAPEEKPEDGFSFLAPIQLGEAHSFVQTDPIAEMDWLLTNGEGDVQLPLNEFQKAPSMLPSLVNKTPFAPVAETMSELQGTLPLANEAALTLQGKYDEEYHNGGEAQSPALCTETDLKDAVEVEEDYFAIINATVPTNLSLKEKREWCGKQNEVLREAFRVQKYNKEARGALEVYNKRAIQGAQLSF